MLNTLVVENQNCYFSSNFESIYKFYYYLQGLCPAELTFDFTYVSDFMLVLPDERGSYIIVNLYMYTVK